MRINEHVDRIGYVSYYGYGPSLNARMCSCVWILTVSVLGFNARVKKI